MDKWIIRLFLDLPRPSVKDNTGDVDRLIKGIKKLVGDIEICISKDLIKQIPYILRQFDYKVQAILADLNNCLHLINVLSKDEKQKCYGIAVDIGTTTLVGAILNIDTGEVLIQRELTNPQVSIGNDILTRIHYASSEENLNYMSSLLLKGINQLISNLTREIGILHSNLLIGSFAGNTTMTHFFLGLTPHWIIREPYIPVVNKIGILKARELGIQINPEAPCFVFPNVGSYFGGDLIAGILSSGIYDSEGICFLVDVGTNAEVVLGNRDWLIGCAGAAGPALEGGVASVGMMAQEGVIDSFFIDPETKEFKYTTIGSGPPKGICGSGLIDLVSQLFLRGMLDIRGKFVESKLKDRLVFVDGIPHVVIAQESVNGRPLLLGQPELDALMRSKAAMYTILTTVANTVGITFQDIERFYVAGTFGSYIKPLSAIILGMIPDLSLEKYISIGNSSLKGAIKLLESKENAKKVMDIRDKIMYLELNVNQEFMNLFSAAKFIPHTNIDMFPTVKRLLNI